MTLEPGLMSNLVVGRIATVVLLVSIAATSGTSAYLFQQQASQQQTIRNDADKVASLNKQIDSLNAQVSSLNTQISQLETLNSQLGGTNSNLVAQIGTLQSQVAGLQSQVSQLEAQVSTLNQTLNLQRSRVIANQVTVDRQSFTTPFPNVIAVINIGSIQNAGYLRVSWPSGPRLNFGIQEFDINITTPIGVSGVYSVPVSANATGNTWFQCYDYYFVNGVYVCSSSFTYSITYWY